MKLAMLYLSAVFVIFTTVWLLTKLAVSRDSCARTRQQVAAFNACKLDTQCKLTAQDHYEWIAYEAKLERCSE